MTIAELIEKLKTYPLTMEVVGDIDGYDYPISDIYILTDMFNKQIDEWDNENGEEVVVLRFSY